MKELLTVNNKLNQEKINNQSQEISTKLRRKYVTLTTLSAISFIYAFDSSNHEMDKSNFLWFMTCISLLSVIGISELKRAKEKNNKHLINYKDNKIISYDLYNKKKPIITRNKEGQLKSYSGNLEIGDVIHEDLLKDSTRVSENEVFNALNNKDYKSVKNINL